MTDRLPRRNARPTLDQTSAASSTRTERAGEAARKRACRGVRGAKPFGRRMKIHEYQAKAILARHGVPVPQGEVVFTRRGGERCCTNAWRDRRRQGADSRRRPRQGRRRQGRQGVRRGRSRPRRRCSAMHLVTHQTGPHGQMVQRVLVEQGLQIKRELYLGLVLDRDRPSGPC